MSANAANAHAYPKRKRAEVSYYEADASDASETDGHDSDVEQASPIKVSPTAGLAYLQRLTKRAITESQSHSSSRQQATTEEEDLPFCVSPCRYVAWAC